MIEQAKQGGIKSTSILTSDVFVPLVSRVLKDAANIFLCLSRELEITV
jgi:hypothetical protein